MLLHLIDLTPPLIKTIANFTAFFDTQIDVLYCIVVGSRRLMPPDALQPRAYCTNPGLYLFLLEPPGVSTRDPSNERRNYLCGKWPVIWTEGCDFHAYTFGFFYMPQICDMGQTALLPFRKETCWGFFIPEKIRRLGPDLNPRTSVWKGSTLPLDHRNCYISTVRLF